MKTPLSPNELEMLDRQVAGMVLQLTEIANLLETRLGEKTELALAARSIQEDFANFARRVHRESAKAGIGWRTENPSKTA